MKFLFVFSHGNRESLQSLRMFEMNVRGHSRDSMGENRFNLPKSRRIYLLIGLPGKNSGWSDKAMPKMTSQFNPYPKSSAQLLLFAGQQFSSAGSATPCKLVA